jgi:long-chain fatty acid transport protein
MDPRRTLGLGINVPFGLVSQYDYDNAWIGRFQGIKSQIKTINVNPAVSWKASESVALGAGLNYQKLDGTATSEANYSAALLQAAAQNGIAPGSPTFNAIAAATPCLVSGATVTGGDHAWGWNLGILVDIDKANRFGAQYRSAIKYTLSGKAEFTAPAPLALPPALAPVVGALAAGVNANALDNSGVTSQIKLPEIVNVSYCGTLNPQWDLMADLQYTGWRTIQQQPFTRSDGAPLQSTTLNFKGAWRFAVGANYRYGEQWLLRGGLAYDQSTVQDAYRAARPRDSGRTWLARGAQYKFTPKLWLDFGGAYIWTRSGSIESTGPSNRGAPPSAASSGIVNGA